MLKSYIKQIIVTRKEFDARLATEQSRVAALENNLLHTRQALDEGLSAISPSLTACWGALEALSKDHIRVCRALELTYALQQESHLLRLCSQLASKSVNLIFDVGANTGQYARSLLEHGYGGRIVSFEPLSSAYEQLTVSCQEFSQWEVAERFALGETRAETQLNVSDNSYSSSILEMLPAHLEAAPDSHYVGQETVKVLPLDDVAGQHSKDGDVLFIKLDVQGFEKQVLTGGRGTLSQAVGLQTELSIVPLYAGQALLPEMIGFIAKSGFYLWDVIPGFSDPATGKLLQVDGIFFRENVG